MNERAKKWAAKLSGDVRKQRIDAQKPDMVRQEAEATKALVKIEEEIKQLVQGEPLLHVPYYIIFAKEIYRLNKTHSSQALIAEAYILEEKWRARGLDHEILEKIKGMYIEAYKNYFKLDISYLDGIDLLA